NWWTFKLSSVTFRNANSASVYVVVILRSFSQGTLAIVMVSQIYFVSQWKQTTTFFVNFVIVFGICVGVLVYIISFHNLRSLNVSITNFTSSVAKIPGSGGGNAADPGLAIA